MVVRSRSESSFLFLNFGKEAVFSDLLIIVVGMASVRIQVEVELGYLGFQISFIRILILYNVLCNIVDDFGILLCCYLLVCCL